jgi:hypothetical protein
LEFHVSKGGLAVWRAEINMITLMTTFFRSLLLAFFVAMTSISAHAQTIGVVNFNFDSAQLDAAANVELDEIATQLRKVNNFKATIIVGYTDAVGSPEYNLRLGQRRANAVAKGLIARGINVDRVGHVRSKGEADLLVEVAAPQRANRRVMVTLDDMMAACRSYREVPLTRASVNDALQSDLEARLETAGAMFDHLGKHGKNTPAYQIAGVAREACSIAVAYAPEQIRKVEYAQRCLCNSARLNVALGR